MTIQVLHWRGDEPALGKYKGKDPIPVAIISAFDFDAMTVDQNVNTLTFGATGTEKSLLHCKKKGKNVKVDKVKDGVKDLVCYFRPDVAGFKPGDVQALMNGKTKSGKAIVGSAALKTFEVSNKKSESWHKRHNIDPRSKKYRPRSKK